MSVIFHSNFILELSANWVGIDFNFIDNELLNQLFYLNLNII